MQKSLLLIVLGILVIAGVAIYLSKPDIFQSYLPEQAQQENKTTPPPNAAASGRVIFGITDAAASLGTIDGVLITVSEVRVHSASKGWITVSEQSRQYNVLQLKQSGVIGLLADANLEAGTYDQVRLTINRVIITKPGGTTEAKLPSGDLKIVGALNVEVGKTSSAVLDFQVDKSLHVTGSGKYIFAPVVKLETRSDTKADVLENQIVITGGRVESDVMVGMDENGETRSGFTFDAQANLDIVGDVIRIVPANENETGIQVTAKAAIDSTIKTSKLDSVLSVKLVTKDGKKAWRVTGLKSLDIAIIYIDVVTGAIIAVE